MQRMNSHPDLPETRAYKLSWIHRPVIAGRVVWKIRDGDIRDVRETLRKNSLLVAYRSDVPPLG